MDLLEPMRGENSTSVTKFILLGLSSNLQEQLILFGVFTAIYMVALMDNVLILPLISLDSRLHTLMYFLLGNLSVVDIGYISSTMPKMLANYLLQDKSISWAFCLTQMFFFISFGGIECLLLGVMAYDRYVVICHPLHYGTVMNSRACVQMAASAWINGSLNSSLHTGNTFALTFCGGNMVDQFFCEIPKLLKLACSDSYLSEVQVLTFSACLGLSCFILITFSYVQIFKTVLRIPSEQGCHKAFSTCLPHLIVVSLFRSCVELALSIAGTKGPMLREEEKNRSLGMLYSAVSPVINLLIYNLRNKEIKEALNKILDKIVFSKRRFSS
ncbi:olfactory receptor 1G1-like [Malaclemys terrapin pileata]|uniref:olfactory receptor 1G1-like n=1 Tax=Malaclemys terrapin pileata TaxID=2991368 RepID=UPI0023A90719|nr:olfactory receptor 1G1-like [Malaclemys terrapin pileata]